MDALSVRAQDTARKRLNSPPLAVPSKTAPLTTLTIDMP